MTQRRWRCDGPDYLIGSQRILEDGRAAGDGGLLGRHVNGWVAYAWRKGADTSTENRYSSPERFFPIERDSRADSLAWAKLAKKAKAWVEKKLSSYANSRKEEI